jgi:hypothetical protein
MKNFPRTTSTTAATTGGNSHPDRSDKRTAANQLGVADRRASSPRACVAFSALHVSQWMTDKFSQLLNRLIPRLPRMKERNEFEAQSGSKTYDSRKRPAVIATCCWSSPGYRPDPKSTGTETTRRSLGNIGQGTATPFSCSRRPSHSAGARDVAVRESKAFSDQRRTS